MAASILTTFLSSFLGKVPFSVTNELTGATIWSGLRIKETEIDSSSANSANPIASDENASRSTVTSILASDIQALKIIQPSHLRIIAICDNNSLLGELISTFLDTQLTVQVSTKGVTAKNMAVISLDIDQNPEMTSATRVIIELEQALPPAADSSFNPDQPSDAQAYGVSIQTPPAATTTVDELVDKIALTFDF